MAPLYIGPSSGTYLNTATAGWVKILKVTGGSSVSDITYDGLLTANYRCLNLVGATIPSNDNAHLNFYFRRNGGDEVANNYSYGMRMWYESNNGYQTAEQNEGRLKIAENAGNANGEGHRFNILIQMNNSADTDAGYDLGNFIFSHITRIDASGNWRGGVGTGWYDHGIYPDGFKLQMSSGSIDHYNYALYGLLA